MNIPECGPRPAHEPGWSVGPHGDQHVCLEGGDGRGQSTHITMDPGTALRVARGLVRHARRARRRNIIAALTRRGRKHRDR